MGELTYAQIEAEVRSGLGGRTDLDSRLQRLVNISQRQLARVHDWEELQVLERTKAVTYSGTAAVDRYWSLSSLTNCKPKEIYSVILYDADESIKLTGIRARQMDSVEPKPNIQPLTRRPDYYVRWATAFEWVPIIDQTYTIDVRLMKWAVDFSDSTQTSDFDKKDDLLIWLTLGYAFENIGEYEKANRFFNRAEANMGLLLDRNVFKPDIKSAPLGAGRVGNYHLDPFTKRMP